MRSTMQNERGFVLITALLILMLLVFLGISIISKSNTELLIAGNEKFDQMTFYQADGGGLGAGVQLLEENLACPIGFTETEPGIADINDTLRVTNLNFWANDLLPSTTQATEEDNDFFFPINQAGPDITYVRTGGRTVPGQGAGFQQAAGYMGKGKGIAGGGGILFYDLFVTHRGESGTETQIWARWRHLVGQEGICLY
jgi:hypothetical protein